MAVAFDAVGPSSAGATSSASTTLSWTHTNVGSGVALVVAVAVGIASDAGVTITCKLDPAGANTTMTALGSIVHSGAGTAGFIALFGLPNTSTGAHTITATVAGGTPAQMEGGSTSYTGADTVTAFGTPQTAAAQGVTNPTITHTGSTAGNMISAGCAFGQPLSSVSVGTSRWIRNVGTSNAAGNGGQADKAAGGSQAITWVGGASDWFAISAVEVLAAAGAPADTTGSTPVWFMQRRAPAFPGPFLQAPLTYWPEPAVSVGAVSVRSSASYASAASETTGTVPLPAGWQIGDVIYIGWELTATTGTVTVPAGWTAVVPQFRPAAVTNAAHGVLRRVAQSGDTNVALTYTSGRFAAVSVAVQGADTTTPEDVTPTTDDNTAAAAYPSVNAPSITPVTADCLLLTFHALRNGTNGASASFTPPAGMAEVNDVTSAVAAASNAAVEVASLALSGTSATGQKTATASSSSGTTINQMGSTIAVRPAAGGGSSFTGSADVAPVSTITATGSASGDAAVAETATIAATGAVVGSAAVSASVAITATGVLTFVGTAAVAPAVALASTGAAVGTADRSETVTIAATGFASGVLKTNSAEGGTNTTTVTTGNSGGASGDAFDAVTVGASNGNTFTTSSPWNGSLSYAFVKASVNQNFVGWTWTGAQSDFVFSIGFRFPAGNLAADEPIIRMFSGSGYTPQVGTLSLLAGAGRKIRVSENVTPTNVDSTAGLALNTDYVAVGRWISGASLTVDIYAKGTLTIVATATVAAPAASVNSVRIGLTGSSNSAVTLIADDLGLGFGAPLARTDLGGFSGSADVAESVTLTASGAGAGSAAVSESVAIVATGNMSASGTAAVAETATIAASGSAVGSAAVSSSVAIAATGMVTLAGTAAVAETVALTATGMASGSAAVSESVALAATGGGVGTAARPVSVAIMATGALTLSGTAAVAETVGITATGSGVGSSAVSETVSRTATGSAVGSAAVSESVTITATGAIVTGLVGTAAVSETVTIAATGNLAASGTAAVAETVNRTAAGTAVGSAAVTPSVSISATGAITWTGTAARSETVTVTAAGAGAGTAQRTATVTITATGFLTIPPVFYGTGGAGHTNGSTGRTSSAALGGTVGHGNASTGRTGTAAVASGSAGTITRASGRPGRG